MAEALEALPAGRSGGGSVDSGEARAFSGTLEESRGFLDEVNQFIRFLHDCGGFQIN